MARRSASGREQAPARERRRVTQVLDLLEEAHPDATIALDYETPLQLLVATILAAQSTDKKINQISPELFQRYPSARDWAEAPLEQLEEDLRPTGFYRQKAKAVRGCCERLVAEHGGAVPEDMEELVALPGVGRKTANVVLGNAFGHPDRVAVDTHVKRLAQRLGFTEADDAERIEADLERAWPGERRTRACHLLQFHGRRTCKAKRPRCDECPVAPLCPAAFTF